MEDLSFAGDEVFQTINDAFTKHQKKIDQLTAHLNPPVISYNTDNRTATEERLQPIVNQLLQVLSAEAAQIREDREKLKKEIESWKIFRQKIFSVSFKNKIKLDVGGQIFATSMKTLVQIPGTFFSEMMSGLHKVEMDKDGCYFIDRDPIVFRHILNFLRGNIPDLSTLSQSDLTALKSDAEFYQLTKLQDMISQNLSEHIQKPETASETSTRRPESVGVPTEIGIDIFRLDKNKSHVGLQYSNDDHTVSGFGTAVADVMFTSGVHYWEVLVDMGVGNGWTRAGVVNSTVKVSVDLGEAIQYGHVTQGNDGWKTGDVLSFLLDLGGKKLKIFLNGRSFFQKNIAQGNYIPALFTHSWAECKLTLLTGRENLKFYDRVVESLK